MKFRLVIQKFLGHSILPWWHILILLISFSEGTVISPFKWILVTLAFLGVFSSDKEIERVILVGYFVGLLGCLWDGLFMAANHFYIVIYFTAALLASSFNGIDASKYARFLVVFVMAVASIQKLSSSFFMGGNFISLLFLQGGFEVFTNQFYSGWSETIASFNQVYAQAKLDIPGSVRGFNYILPPSFHSGIRITTISIVGVEIILTGALLYFNGIARGWLIFIFVWATFLIRREHAFFSLLCILSLAQIPEKSGNLSYLLKGSILIFVLLKLT